VARELPLAHFLVEPPCQFAISDDADIALEAVKSMMRNNAHEGTDTYTRFA
jgi:hypothetical protein